MARIKKGDPELLLVSFCDILTISIAGLFMATIITVFEATKIPELSMTPKALPTTKVPLFFECRDNQIYYVDKEGLDTQITRLLSSINPSVKGDPTALLKVLSTQDVGNEHYKVLPSFLLTAVVALEPRAGSVGIDLANVESPKGRFQSLLSTLDKEKYYIAFLVRDESFPVLRSARVIADKIGFDTGWELLAADEPIKFGAGGASIGTQ